MNTSTKTIISLVLAVVITVAIYEAYQYPKTVNSLGAVTTSSAGATFASAKVAQVTMIPATLAATTTSLLNTDAADRWVESSFASCANVGTSKTTRTGLGLAAWRLQAATTTVATLGLQGSTKYASNLLLATSTAFIKIASTTSGFYAGNWPTGTYMTFLFNATNTAACTVGVHYLGS